MIFNNDLVEYICNILCIYSYNNCDIYKFINRQFNINIKKKINELNNTNHNILMATHIKHWKHCIEQTPYIYSEFIIFDDFKFINEWINSNIDYSKLDWTEDNTIYREIIDINLHEYYTYNNYKYLENDIILTDKYKFKYDLYFIYYLYDDLYTCLGIKIIILPYFDERLINKETFIQYKKIRKNIFYNHNIEYIRNIKF